MRTTSRRPALTIAPILALAALAACATAERPSSRALAPAATQALTATLQAEIAAGRTPGAIVVVSEAGRVVYEHAEGVWEKGSTEPLRPDTVFWTASLSKPIATVAVLMLLEEGKLRLDDPVGRFIPEFNRPAQVRVLRPGSPPIPQGPNAAEAPQPIYDLVPAARPITVRDLLTHTSGLQSIGVPNAAVPPLAEGDTLASWTPRLATVPLDFQPGSKWAYSNAVAFDVVSRIVEVASGEPFDRFLERRIFQPLEMRESGFGLVGRPAYAGRSMIPSPQLLQDPRIKGNTYLSGAAGLWTTARDYTHFGEMLANGGEWRGRRLLRPATVAMMTSEQANGLYPGIDRQTRTPGFGMGLGVHLVTAPLDARVRVPAGSFGWDGAGGKRFWASPRQKRVLMIYATSRPAQAAIEDAVLRAMPAP